MKRIQDYINEQLSNGLTYEAIVKNTADSVRLISEKTEEIEVLKDRLSSILEDFGYDFYRLIQKIEERVSDPSRSIDYKTVNSNYQNVKTRSEARFLMDVISRKH
ncbi:MAG: hypothetical protein WC617_05130 [Rhodanobacter sp.]|jgi:hypothetical protein